ncbi:MAG: hypothetical protein AAF525_14930 [Pseudomonadota bacterium]
MSDFADRWSDVWYVHYSPMPVGIGRISSSIDHDNVVIHHQVDFQAEGPIERFPEHSTTHVWLSSDLVLTQLDPPRWSKYVTREGASTAGAESMANRGMRYESDTTIVPNDDNTLSIRESRDDSEQSIKIQSESPVLPDVWSILYVSLLAREKGTTWPLQLMGFHRSMEGRQWGVGETAFRYAGKRGPLTGLSHTFETVISEKEGRVFSIWFEESGRFIGWSDEVESVMAVDSEEHARFAITEATRGKR